MCILPHPQRSLHFRHFSFAAFYLNEEKSPFAKSYAARLSSDFLVPGVIPGEPHLVGGWATPLKSMKVNWDD